MTILISGLILFTLIHLLPVFQNLRNRLAGTLGEAVYKTLFSLISAFAIGLMVFGKSSAEIIFLYQPPVWGQHAAWLLMLIAFILLASTQGPSALRSALKHPMLLGVVIWGTGHLLANGDLASVVLFGGMAGFSLLMIALLLWRDGVKPGISYSWRSTLIQSLVGAVIYLFVLYAHPFLFGVAVI